MSVAPFKVGDKVVLNLDDDVNKINLAGLIPYKTYTITKIYRDLNTWMVDITNGDNSNYWFAYRFKLANQNKTESNITMKGGDMIDECAIPTRTAASDFVTFLLEERARHIQAIADCRKKLGSTLGDYANKAWETSITRHIDDINNTDKTIGYLVVKFSLDIKYFIETKVWEDCRYHTVTIWEGSYEGA